MGDVPLDAFLLDSVPPIDSTDLGRGARLLVPNGLAFGALQLRRAGKHLDWVRARQDRHAVADSRHALHLGVDLAFYVRRGLVHMLPEGLPVRAPADGVVAASFAGGTAELEPGGMIVLHGTGDRARVCPITYLGDVRDAKRPGEQVCAGEVIARTFAQRHGGRTRVLVHFGIGLSIPGHGLEFLDPTPLLKRWRVRHPVFPGSTCTPIALGKARPGTWRGRGVIEGGAPGPAWRAEWRTRW